MVSNIIETAAKVVDGKPGDKIPSGATLEN